MLFKVMTVGRAEAMIRKQSEPLVSKTIIIPPNTILDVYACVRGEDTRFVAWNEQYSATFFTVGIIDCKPL